MAIETDFQVAANGNIRYTGSGTNYTVIAFHRWLGDLMDNAQASGDDILDITDATASERSTDNIVTLNSPYNIDDIAAQHLYDGSIVQGGASTTIYDGLVVYAPAATPLQIVRDGKILSPNFWGTGLNADATNGISHRFMVKVRSAGTDIDGRRLIGQSRQLSKTYTEFKINGTSRGNNTIALAPSADLNNETVESTIKGWTTITNAEGYRIIDVNNDGVSENYYSEWNRAALSINQLYERAKWLSMMAKSEDAGTDTGTNYVTGNGTVNGQSQSFTVGVNSMYLCRVQLKLKKVGSPTGNLVVKLYDHSGTYGTSSVPDIANLRATSDNLDVATLTTAYQTIEIGFSTQYKMIASTYYVIAIEYTAGDASNYVHVEGAATGAHSGNRAQKNGSWVAAATSDLWFSCWASAELYEMAGEKFRGITHELAVDNGSGAFQTVEPISWPTGSGQMLAQKFCDTGATTLGVNASLQFTRSAGSFLTDGFRKGMTIVTTGFTTGGNNTTKIVDSVTTATITVTNTTGLVEEAGTGDEQMKAGHMWIQLLTGIVPADNDQITGGESTQTCNMNGTAIERDLSRPFIGASTGSAIIGGYGVGVEFADLSANDKLFDFSNTQRIPPNVVTFTVTGLVAEEDYVLVGPETGSTFYFGERTLATALTGATEIAVVVNSAIPSDTPSSGTIRIELNSGIYRKVSYTSFSGSTYTIPSTDFTADNASVGNDVMRSFIDESVPAGQTTRSFQVVYAAERSLYVRVRDGGSTPIKTFQTTSPLGSAGGSAVAIRTPDA